MIVRELKEKLDLPQETVIYAKNRFNEHSGKTARGIIKYSSLFDVNGVIDPSLPNKDVNEVVEEIEESKAKIYGSFQSYQREREADSLILGVSPAGGELPKPWLKDIKKAIKDDYNIISGLHTFLSEKKELRNLSQINDVELIDVRKPPRTEELSVAEGKTLNLDTEIVLCLGTDCAVGKMTTTKMLYQEALENGLDAAWVATGQTGVLCGAEEGMVVDRVPSDFVAGAVEEMVYSLRDKEIIFVEGQGALFHRAYSAVTLGILHGANPDQVVLAHDPSRDERPHFPRYNVRGIREEIKAIEKLGDTKVTAINTWGERKEIAKETGLVTKNIHRDGVTEIYREVSENMG